MHTQRASRVHGAKPEVELAAVVLGKRMLRLPLSHSQGERRLSQQARGEKLEVEFAAMALGECSKCRFLTARESDGSLSRLAVRSSKSSWLLWRSAKFAAIVAFSQPGRATALSASSREARSRVDGCVYVQERQDQPLGP